MNQTNNPFTATQTPIIPQSIPGNLVLASRGSRLGAAFIDGLVLLPVNFIATKMLVKQPTQEEIQAAAQSGLSVLEIMEKFTPGVGTAILLQLVLIAAYVGINFTFLKNGQTIGKKALGLQIQRRGSGGLVDVKELLLRRVLPVQGVGILLGFQILPLTLLGILYLLVDFCCIFRRQQNTLHDDFARTRVVKL